MRNEEFDAHRFILNLKDSLYESLLYGVKNIAETGEEEEIYFHDRVFEVVDSSMGGKTRKQNLEIIDYTGHEGYIDKGVVDFDSGLDRLLLTMAFECAKQELFEDDFIQKLQSELNNEVIGKEKAEELKEKLENKRERIRERLS